MLQKSLTTIKTDAFTNILSFTNTLHVVLGSIFLALASQVAVYLPFTPVPITMQTLAILLLVMLQGKSKATVSIILYLVQATAGLPVLAGGEANPFWIVGPRAGYLVGFAAAAWLAGTMLECRPTSFLWTLLSLTTAHIVILLMGMAWLSTFVGWDNSFAAGVIPFIPGTILKTLAAACLAKPIAWSIKK